jgi:glutamate N-acetyltransferase/amino-acid N-acetyltransferase
MIAPDLQLATMLAFVTTDAPVPPSEIGRLATEILEPKFESLTVDASPSTNDTVLVFASGAAGGELVLPGTPAWDQVAEAVEEVGESLVQQLIADAEGVTHVIVVRVFGAATTQDARMVAKAVAESPLVKAAAFGGDPNPGRILQAIGSSGVGFLPQAVEAAIGEVMVIAGGEIPPSYREGDADLAREAMKQPQIVISVSLGEGPGESRALGCDLSYDYVRINGEYTT